MNDLIFETLLAEAQFRVAKKTIKGISLDEAIQEVSNEMELDAPEVNELTVRAKKTPSPKPVAEDDAEEVETDIEVESADQPNQIKFGSPDELDTAVGVLMYKGIPWISKTLDTITFDNSNDMADAHDALKRRWDFVNLEQRTVAVLEFDNLDDYNKVLDFISSKNMTVLQADLGDLDADIDLELAEAETAHKKAKKDAKEMGLPAPAAVSQDMSYQALHKDKIIDPKSLEPFYDADSRALRVVKRWK